MTVLIQLCFIMSKFSQRLFLVLLFVLLHAPLLICQEENCFSKSFGLPFDHPVSRALTWMIDMTPFTLGSVQQAIRVAAITEGVILLTYLFEFFCRCLYLVIKLSITILIARSLYQLSQQDFKGASGF